MAEQQSEVYKRQHAIRNGEPTGDRTIGPYTTSTSNVGYVGARCRVAYGNIVGQAFAANDELAVAKFDRDHYRPVMLGIRHGAGGAGAKVRDSSARFYSPTVEGDISAAGTEIVGPINNGFTNDRLELFFPAAVAAAAGPEVWCIFAEPSGEID